MIVKHNNKANKIVYACRCVERMVKLRKDTKAIPFPRRVSGTEIDRFWRKLQEDVLACGEIMPTKSEFYRKFSNVFYNSYKEALENFRGFKNACCRGEEYELPEKFKV